MWIYLSILLMMPVCFMLTGCSSAPECRADYLFTLPLDCQYKKTAAHQVAEASYKK